MNTRPILFKDVFNHIEYGINSIEIPLIQRDYAQGRATPEIKRIREVFLDVLFKSISRNETVILDFVYGNIKDGKLIPLDGQQRLTTLYLLHWYAAKKEKIPQSEWGFLDRFKYRTRFSTAHFCEKLMACTPDFTSQSLSNWLRNCHWFKYAWERDPSIQSILVMLDDIHYFFGKTDNVWAKLTNQTNPVICFYFLPLEKMGLTDSLYIKMNSRGKPLTDFEHFKAEFEKVIKPVSVELHDEFAKKVDINWTDLLWENRKTNDVLDDEFIRFYRFITEVICLEEGLQIQDEDFVMIREVYGPQNENAQANLRFLFSCFDCWISIHDITDFFNEIFSNGSFVAGKVSIYSSDINLFKRCCSFYTSLANEGQRKFSLSEILLLYGVLVYLVNNSSIKKEDFIERIRIVRNLAFNSSDELRRERMGVLLGDVRNIILYGTIPKNNLGFNELQKQEENEKIVWRKFNTSLIVLLNKIEDHELLQGAVSIIEFESIQKLEKRVESFFNMFNGKINFLKISGALLTIGDYSQLLSWRFLLGSQNKSSWRELFTRSRSRKNFEQTREILVTLLDDVDSDCEKYIENLIETYLEDENIIKDWRYYFIKYPTMRSGHSGMYCWRNDPKYVKQNPYQIWMMNTSQSLTGRHWDPFLLTVYREDQLNGLLSLEEYGDPLIINESDERIKFSNDNWEIYDKANNLISSVKVPQTNGIDTVDRIELLKQSLKSYTAKAKKASQTD